MWCLMDSLNKEAMTNYGVSLLDSSCMRSFLMLLFMAGLMRYLNKSPYDIPMHLRQAVLYRSIGLSATVCLVGIALLVLPVTITNVIINCTPFFTAILSYFFLSDKLTTCEILAMFISFSGVVLIAYATPDTD